MLFSTIVASLAFASVAMGQPISSTSTSSQTKTASSAASQVTDNGSYKNIAAIGAPSGANVQDGVYISCKKPGVYALTFDDGPYEYSWDLAKSLKAQGIPATFFINGNNWVNVETDSVFTSDGEKTYMEVIKHYKDMGHEIGSHTYQHKDLASLSAADVEYQMNTQSDIIYKATGVRPAMMRPPSGSFSQDTLVTLRNLGYSVIDWDIDTQDWNTHNLADEQAAYKIMDKDTSSTFGHIALEHETYDQTVNQLVPWVLQYVKSKGYKFVTMSECLDVPAYYN